MNYSTYRFTLDLQKHQSQMSIAVFQYDTAVRLSISLTDGGKPYYVEDGVRAVLYGKRADGKEIAHRCMIKDRTEVIYEFEDTTACIGGLVQCQLRLYGTDGRLITAPRFVIVVDERLVDNIDLPDSSPFSALDEIFANEEARQEAEAEREKMIAHLKWDYVITDISEFTTAKFAELAEKSENNPFTVLVKDVKSGTPQGDPPVVVIPSTCTMIHFSNCEIYAQVEADAEENANGYIVNPAPTTISGFKGMYSTTDKKISGLYYFEKVEDCSVCYVYNCQTVLNSKIHKLRSSNFSFYRAENITLYNYVDETDRGANAIVIGSNAHSQISNVIFERNVAIHGIQTNISGGYFKISNAKGLSNVTAPKNVTIEYNNCTFASPFTCKDYANAYAGQVPVITTDGSFAAKNVLSQNELDTYLAEHYLSKDEASSVYKYKGSVEYHFQLPSNERQVGDVYNVQSAYTDSTTGTYYPAGTNFAWDGEKWDALGGDNSKLILAHQWDHIITSLDDLNNTNYMNSLSGNVLVSGIKIGTDKTVQCRFNNTDIRVLAFNNCNFQTNSCEFDACYPYDDSTSRKTVFLGFESYQNFDACVVKNFFEVADCVGGFHAIDCRWVHDCRIDFPTTIEVSGESLYYPAVTDIAVRSDLSLKNCKTVRNIVALPYYIWGNTGGTIRIENSDNISNISRTYEPASNLKIKYTDCTHVVGATCQDYYTEDDVDKVEVVTADGTKKMVSLEDVGGGKYEEILGDLSTVLEKLHSGGIA